MNHNPTKAPNEPFACFISSQSRDQPIASRPHVHNHHFAAIYTSTHVCHDQATFTGNCKLSCLAPPRVRKALLPPRCYDKRRSAPLLDHNGAQGHTHASLSPLQYFHNDLASDVTRTPRCILTNIITRELSICDCLSGWSSGSSRSLVQHDFRLPEDPNMTPITHRDTRSPLKPHCLHALANESSPRVTCNHDHISLPLIAQPRQQRRIHSILQYYHDRPGTSSR